jgi:hypothetical protein
MKHKTQSSGEQMLTDMCYEDRRWGEAEGD